MSIVDGTRRQVRNDFRALLRVLDGRKRAVVTQWIKGARIRIKGLPFYDNPEDNYTVVVHADGYEDAGLFPLRLQSGREIDASVMLLPSNGRFHFLPYADLLNAHPQVAKLVANGATDPVQRYTNTLEASPTHLGALLTIGTAIEAIALAGQTNAFQYHWEVIWDLLMPDRFWAWVDARLADQICDLYELNSFAAEAAAGHWHPGIPGRIQPATRSWKQTRFDVSNVQLTFHENDRDVRTDANGNQVPCVIIEPDIDYFKDAMAHGLLEVLPNQLTRGKTDPRTAYALRWMATRQEGLPDFNPPCTIE